MILGGHFSMSTKIESFIPSLIVFHFFRKQVAQFLRYDVRRFSGRIFDGVVVAPVIIFILSDLTFAIKCSLLLTEIRIL